MRRLFYYTYGNVTSFTIFELAYDFQYFVRGAILETLLFFTVSNTHIINIVCVQVKVIFEMDVLSAKKLIIRMGNATFSSFMRTILSLSR